MKTLLALATGAVFLPALLGGARAHAAPGVHLVTSIQALPHVPGVVRYAVTVRPVRGPARSATLVLGTRRPAVWTDSTPACLASRDRTTLACDLGDLRESESRTLTVTGRPGGSGPAEVPVIARAAAANTPSVTSSLGGVRPVSLPPFSAVARAVRAREAHGKSFVRAADESPSAPPAPSSAGPAAAESPAVESPAVESPAVESPAVESPAAQAGPGALPPVESPSARPSESSPEAESSPEGESPAISPPISPAVGSHAVRPLERGAPSRIAPRNRLSGPHRASGAPGAPASPGASATPLPKAGGDRAATAAPIVPHVSDVPAMPDVPGAAASPMPPPPPALGAQNTPLPGASTPAVLPQIAARPSPSEGVSEQNTLSPVGAMQAGRTSWATLIAVVVVGEAGMLWLVAGLTVWRRKRVQKPGRRPRTRSSWPVISRLIP
jgi:hypothetical protein